MSIEVNILIDKKDWKNLYMFYYSQFVYLYEESGTTNDETIEYIGKYWDILGENYGLLCEDSYENDDMMHLGLTIDRMHNDRPGYALRTNYVWIKYSNDYRGSFMCNHPYDENKSYINTSEFHIIKRLLLKVMMNKITIGQHYHKLQKEKVLKNNMVVCILG